MCKYSGSNLPPPAIQLTRVAYLNDQHLGNDYVLDSNGNVMDHHCDLVNLVRDLQVLREEETVEGCNIPQAVRVGVVMEPADPIAADLAEILAATIGPVIAVESQARSEVAIPASQTSPISEVEWEGMRDKRGRLWVSWPKQERGRHEW